MSNHTFISMVEGVSVPLSKRPQDVLSLFVLLMIWGLFIAITISVVLVNWMVMNDYLVIHKDNVFWIFCGFPISTSQLSILATIAYFYKIPNLKNQ